MRLGKAQGDCGQGTKERAQQRVEKIFASPEFNSLVAPHGVKKVSAGAYKRSNKSPQGYAQCAQIVAREHAAKDIYNPLEQWNQDDPALLSRADYGDDVGANTDTNHVRQNQQPQDRCRVRGVRSTKPDLKNPVCAKPWADPFQAEGACRIWW